VSVIYVLVRRVLELVTLRFRSRLWGAETRCVMRRRGIRGEAAE
jgi:hypothetical protein